MDVRNIPLLGPIFDWAENFAAQGIGQRILVYSVFYLVAVLLAGWIVVAFHWYSLLGAGGTLALAVVFMAFFLMGIDPENQYTKEDVIALFVTAAIAPAVFWLVVAGASAGLAQIASPVVLMADTAAKTAAQGVTAPAASGIAEYLGNLFMHTGALFAAMGLKYVVTE